MTNHQDTSTERVDTLIKRLRYMGRQYSAGQYARGGGAQKHYLEDAADEIERLRAALASRPAATGTEREKCLAAALLHIKYTAVSLADAQVIALEALASRDEAAQQPQGQAVSDEEIEKLAMKAGAQHDCMDRLCLKGIDEIKRFRAILALRDGPSVKESLTVEQRVPLSDDFATIAGLESAVGHLSTLVDEQRALLVESEDVFGRDGHGGRYEDGECNLIDRIRAHLEMTAPPPNGTTAKE